MALTDRQRAAIFARDKAICCFSGLSVWYLDHGAAPFSHPDWVDHVRPVSKGGHHKLENMVCASYFYNRKKLNNGSDRQYLFAEGRPTETFFWTHGELSSEQAKVLARHACIDESDWYFNRALYNIAVAFENQSAGQRFSRSSDYWLGAAHKRLLAWRRLCPDRGGSWFLKRGLVRYPNAPDVKLMLDLTTADRVEMNAIFSRLSVHYRANVSALAAFIRARNREQRNEIVQKAEKTDRVTEPLLVVLRRNASRIR